jgi:DNA-binding NtrC family response regulator
MIVKERSEMAETKKILIADDESIVRESLTDWLTDRGYRVITAANGEETLRMLNKGDGLGVGVLDVRMPGKDGITILEEARKRYPDLKYIIISGYPSVDVMTKGIRLGAIGFLVKPFDPEELEKLIRHALHGEEK